MSYWKRAAETKCCLAVNSESKSRDFQVSGSPVKPGTACFVLSLGLGLGV